MTKDELRKEIFKALKKSYKKAKIVWQDIDIEKPQNPRHGDLSTNIALKISNTKDNPHAVAEKIFSNLKLENYNINIAGPGFINFYLKKEYYAEEVKKILKEKGKFGNSDLFKGKKVQIEFISANPTGPLTLANGRGGFSGDVLANIFKKAGAEVVREYYVNDGGNQINVLGRSMLIASGIVESEDDYYRGQYIKDWLKKNKSKVKKYKGNIFKLGQLASKGILEKYIKKTVKTMNISFDRWFSEYEMIKSKEVEKALAFLKRKKLTFEKDGALWFKTTKFNDDKDRVLIKQNNEKTYFLNDVAYHWDKFKKRKFDKVINLWGADHHGYIRRMKAAVSAIGNGDDLDVILIQWVRLIQDGKELSISKRKGTYITVDDLLERVNKKNIKEASDVVRFLFLTNSFNTHMDFNLDTAREKEAQKNPVYYVKYAYARLSGVLRQARQGKNSKSPKLELLTHPAEISLIKELARLPEIVEEIAGSKYYPVNKLTFYAIDIATKFHLFYDKCRVIDKNNPELSKARLKLVEATKIVLKIVMGDLIGIDTPEKM